jgi:hypothetical protein
MQKTRVGERYGWFKQYMEDVEDTFPAPAQQCDVAYVALFVRLAFFLGAHCDLRAVSLFCAVAFARSVLFRPVFFLAHPIDLSV